MKINQKEYRELFIFMNDFFYEFRPKTIQIQGMSSLLKTIIGHQHRHVYYVIRKYFPDVCYWTDAAFENTLEETGKWPENSSENRLNAPIIWKTITRRKPPRILLLWSVLQFVRRKTSMGILWDVVWIDGSLGTVYRCIHTMYALSVFYWSTFDVC